MICGQFPVLVTVFNTVAETLLQQVSVTVGGSKVQLEPHSTVSGRPVSAFTFWANFQFHDRQVFGYHVVNLAIHLTTAPLFALLAPD